MNQTGLRVVAALGAPLIGTATLSQGWLSAEDAMAHGASLAEGVWRYLCYFTVLTNLLVTATLTRAAITPGVRAGLNAPRFELMTVAAILFTGAIYNLLLASQWDPHGLRKLNDVVLHDVSPLLFALFWLLRPGGGLTWRDGLAAAAWPLAYAAYGLTRGAFDGFYPYFFMNPVTTSLTTLLQNMAGLIAIFIAAALLLVALDRGRARGQPQI